MSYKNIVATIGTYQKDGQTKYVNRTVGQMVETQYGPKIKLDASFNPAGCMRGEDGTVWLALFDPEPRQNIQGGSTQQKASAQQKTTQSAPTNDNVFDDDIPY